MTINGVYDIEVNDGVKEIWLESKHNDLILFHITTNKENVTEFEMLYEGYPIADALSETDIDAILAYLNTNNITLAE